MLEKPISIRDYFDAVLGALRVTGPVGGVALAPQRWTPLGDQQISNATLAAATALTVPAGATLAMLQVDGESVRWRDSGSDPTAAIGIQLSADDGPVPYTGDLAAIKFIRTADGAILNISYYKPAE